MKDWRIYQGVGKTEETEEKHANDPLLSLPPAPPWRAFHGTSDPQDDAYAQRLLAHGGVFQPDEEVVDLVNTALYLRRPLLVTGKPGCGKTSLAYSIMRELRLDPVLRWSITSSTKLADGLYHYDAIGRLQDASLEKSTLPAIGDYIRLGPLGAALLPSNKPRVLLIDEIDKSDIDLPNDLLHIFEEGEFEIPELVRLSQESMQVEVYYGKRGTTKVRIEGGRVCCREFPIIVLTSNGEREFPPAFLRRCLRLEMKIPDKDKLRSIIEAHLGPEVSLSAEDLITTFLERRRSEGVLSTDQLLNAVYLASRGVDVRTKESVLNALLKPLSNV